MLEGKISRRNLLRTAGAAGAIAAVGTGVAAKADTVGTSSAAAAAPAEPLQLVRVWASKSKRHLLAGFDDTHVRYADGSQQYLMWPGDLARLAEIGLRHEVEVADLRALHVAMHANATRPAGLAQQPGERSNYREYADFEKDMRALVAAHPTKARIIELPHKTLEQRSVYALEIATDVSKQDGRPVFYNDGVHHAREWPAAELPIMWAFDLLENYGKDPRITALVDHTRNIVVPVVNADGYVYSRTFPIETGTPLTGDGIPEETLLGGIGAYVRKNRRALLSSDVGDGALVAEPKPSLPYVNDGYGVDVNRNYPYSWGDDEGGSSSSMLDQTYRGTDPGSEQETKNVISILHGHHVLALVTHHTDGDLVLWPWGDTYADAPDNSFLEGVGRAMATYNGYKPEKSIGLYATTGTTDDYLYGTTGGYGYTFEHAGVAFHPPYASTVPAMYAKNREALIMLASLACLAPEQRPKQEFTPAAKAELAKKSLKGALTHAIITGRTVNAKGKPVAGVLTISKTFDTLLWKAGNGTDPLTQRALTERLETSMVTGTDGSFEWHVNPSTRPILAAAGKTETYLLTITGPQGSGISKQIVVKRGQRIKLGDVVVA